VNRRHRAGGVDKHVDFVETHDADDAVDDAYRTKYGATATTTSTR
jgi:hypothetical protein